MAQVSLSKTMDVPAERLWERVRDLPGYGDWLVIHKEWRGELPTELGVGTTFSSTVSVKGLANPVDWTVDGYEEPRLLAMSGTGPMGLKIGLRIEVTEKSGRSEVSVDSTMNGGPLVGPMGKLVERATKGDVKKSLDQLEKLL